MAENTIENGELYPNSSNISTESGDISQHNKKHILLSFCYVNIIIFLCITSTCQDLIFYFTAIMRITIAFCNIIPKFAPISVIISFIIATPFANFILWFIRIVSWFSFSHILPFIADICQRNSLNNILCNTFLKIDGCSTLEMLLLGSHGR